MDLRLASRSGLFDHPANAVLVHAEHRLDDGHRGHHHEVAGAVDAVKLGHFFSSGSKSMAAMRLRRWRWRFAAHGVQHALIGLGPEIVCAHLNAVEWSTMLPATRAKALPCPVALVYPEPQLAEWPGSDANAGKRSRRTGHAAVQLY